MHELSLCEGVIQILAEQAGVQHYARVKAVWLEIGALAGVEVEALRFGFEAVAHGTLADGARLEIISVPGRAWCFACGKAVALTHRGASCPQCGSYRLEVIGGEELRIKELEVE